MSSDSKANKGTPHNDSGSFEEMMPNASSSEIAKVRLREVLAQQRASMFDELQAEEKNLKEREQAIMAELAAASQNAHKNEAETKAKEDIAKEAHTDTTKKDDAAKSSAKDSKSSDVKDQDQDAAKDDATKADNAAKATADSGDAKTDTKAEDKADANADAKIADNGDGKAQDVESVKSVKSADLGSDNKESNDEEAEAPDEEGDRRQLEELMTKTPNVYYPIVVYTPEQLKEAQKSGAERILIKGDLAKKLSAAFKGLGSLSTTSLNALALCLSGAALFAPFTGGVSLGAAGTVMGTVGAALTATAIAAISAIGLSLVLAVFKGYDEIKLGGGGVELHIKKSKTKDEANSKDEAQGKKDKSKKKDSKHQ